LSADDARWSIRAYAARAGLRWDLTTIDQIMAISGGYPAFLRGVCEAAVSNTPLVPSALRDHPAVKLRLDEFWADAPAPGVLSRCGLSNNPLLQDAQAALDDSGLTAKEALLLAALRARPGQLISKDELICAVWPEDQVYELGLRDDSLAQLVRRLRQKVGKDRIASVIGRGYRWIKDE
jgi:DNA-binding response OmpR family regulator